LKKDKDVHNMHCCKCLKKIVLTFSSSSSILSTRVAILKGDAQNTMSTRVAILKGDAQNTMIQMYTFKFVQNLPISVFTTRYLSFSEFNACCNVTWGDL
jgi:hypothetical protein